jgi:hypothetical protein
VSRTANSRLPRYAGATPPFPLALVGPGRIAAELLGPDTFHPGGTIRGGTVTHYDVIISGTGAGGGTLARHLAPSGKRMGLLERAGWLRLLDRLGASRYAAGLRASTAA